MANVNRTSMYTISRDWVWKLWVNNPPSKEFFAETNITTFDNSDNLPPGYIEDLKNMEKEAPNHYKRYVLNSFDEEDKEFLRQHITVKDHEPPIDALARSLYQMRSEFVHFARLIAELSPGTIFSTRQGKLMIIGLDLRGLSRLFEHGCLRHFGYVAAFPSPGT